MAATRGAARGSCRQKTTSDTSRAIASTEPPGHPGRFVLWISRARTAGARAAPIPFGQERLDREAAASSPGAGGLVTERRLAYDPLWNQHLQVKCRARADKQPDVIGRLDERLLDHVLAVQTSARNGSAGGSWGAVGTPGPAAGPAASCSEPATSLSASARRRDRRGAPAHRVARRAPPRE